MYLVIVDNIMLDYADRYRLFEDQEEALEYAKEHGYENLLGFNRAPGMMNVCHAEYFIGIINLPVQKSDKVMVNQ